MTVFVFEAPTSRAETVNMVKETINSLGGKYADRRNTGKWRAEKYATITSCKADFYFYEKDSKCNVRVVIRNHVSDVQRFWYTFLKRLFELYPTYDFGINMQKPRYIMAVLDLAGNTKEVVTTQTSGGTSLGGFLLGGLVFGAPGAVVGGLSGTQYTTGTTKTVFSDSISVRILWNDGCITEENLSKKSRLYQEIMTILA